MVPLIVSGLLFVLVLVRWSRRGAGYGSESNNENQIELKQPSDLESVVMTSECSTEVNLRQHLVKPWKYSMPIGLRKLDEDNWLVMDGGYLREQRLRAKHLAESTSQVLQCLPGSEAACLETLELVVGFLTKKWPDDFELFGEANEDDETYFVMNNRTHEAFQIVAPYEVAPLEIVVRLAMEDFDVLVKGEGDEGYYVKACANFHAAKRRLKERIGWPVASLYEPMSLYGENLGASADQCLSILSFFSRMKPSDSMERSNFSVRTSPTSTTGIPNVHDLIIRRKKQTFRRLTKSNAILSTVRRYTDHLVDLNEGELGDFADSVRAWPDDVASYNGRDVWGPAVLDYCDEVLKRR
ncbi:MAG: hypothetical protein M1840_008079 [Geoglossum simile]|nr:MAG: hypothetical protein M1840_008079 [Geoglossum simile]